MKKESRLQKIGVKIWIPVLVLLLWTNLLVVYSRIFNVAQYADMPTSLMFGMTLADHLGMLLMYFGVSGISFAMFRRNWKWRMMVPVHVILLPVFTLIQVVVYAWLGETLIVLFHRQPNPLAFSLPALLKANWVYLLFVYIAIVGGATALFNSRRFREKERYAGELQNMLDSAQLQSLRVQLQPHFLFNVLNTISSYIYENPDTAVKIVARLSELLRTSLDNQHQTYIPLAQEMGILEKYLAIEQLRFSDRLQVRISIHEETTSALVPSFLLQPLVENAIRHGIAGQIAGGTVEITACRQGEHLILQVLDNGSGTDKNWQDSPGIGLRNTRSRLERLYGKACSFKAGNRSSGGFEVEITLPFRLEQDARELTSGGT